MEPFMTRLVRNTAVPVAMIAAACLLATALSPGARAETPASDPKAVEIADQVMTSLGGKQRWEALHYLKWTFEASVNDTIRPGGRHHTWDKFTGWHGVDGTNRAGMPYHYVENLNDSTGKAWVNHAPIEGDSLKKLMRSAHAAWINDSYWFLMPYKLRDPGVTLKYDGESRDSTGKVFDRLALSFENVGMTPGDHYWVYVNRANHRVEKWEHLLQGAQPPPVPWTWEGWEEHDGLWFPTAHRNGSRIIYTHLVETPHALKPEEMGAP
jgi:hypothetical protein